MENTKILLIKILSTTSLKIFHKKQIMEQESIKFAHIYCKIHNISGQVMGSLIENYIREKYNMTKNCASLCIGDVKYNNINYEIKVSNGGKEHNKFNYVQIRLNHDCEYLLTAYHINELNINELGELFIFKLNKQEMKLILFKFGNYAHGTIRKMGKITEEDLNNVLNEKEYALRPKYGDNCWKTLLNYRIDSLTYL